MPLETRGFSLFKKSAEFWLLVAAAGWIFISLVASVWFPLGNWFARSGSVAVILGVVVDFRISREQHEQISDSTTMAGLGVPADADLPKDKKRLATAAHITAIIGTLVWGYGGVVV